MDKILSDMQSRFPHIYDVYNKKSVIYALLSVYAERFYNRDNIINRLYAMIGIDSTYDEDLEHRWGSLLGVYRQSGESYKDYRSRLMIIYTSLVGGTSEAIKYAIASTIGISSDPDVINKYIHVYDAWEYNGALNSEMESEIKSYGNIVCTVDLSANEGISFIEDKIMNSIMKTKASGISPYLLFLYNTEELARLYHIEDDYFNITRNEVDAGNIKSNCDKILDSVGMISEDNSEMRHDVSMYGMSAINSSLTLNNNLITNMGETDSHADRIIFV